MRKINNFENVQEATEFKRLPVDAYVCKIMNVTDVPVDSKTGKGDYLKVFFDIAEGEYKGYFKKQFDNDTRKDKKWPSAGSFIRSYKENALPMFKGFTSALEKSNKNYTWDWNEKKLTGKTIVLIIGDEEYLSQKGEKRTRNYVASVRSLEAFKSGDFTLPALKVLDESKIATSGKTAAPADYNPFGDVDEDTTSNTTNDSSEDNDMPWGDSNPFGD